MIPRSWRDREVAEENENTKGDEETIEESQINLCSNFSCFIAVMHVA
jgi:hypothetical protein